MRDARDLDALAARVLRQSRTFATVTEWADARRWVTASTARPRKWRTADVPYTRGIMDACSLTHKAERVTVKKGNQLAITEAGVLNMIGYVIDSWPAPVLVVLPRQEDVGGYVATRFRPAMAGSPSVAAKLGRGGAEGIGVNLVEFAQFPGGQIYFQGPRSPIREKAIGVGIIDDADACGANREGDIVELVAKRQVTYAGRRKLIVISTPTDAGDSVIDREYHAGSRNRYHVPCPDCGAFAPLEWDRLVWLPEAIGDVRHQCAACGTQWPESQKMAALRKGIWIAEQPERSDIHESFHLPALYSPFRTWPEIVRDFIKAKDVMAATGDTSLMQVWANCDKGEVFVRPEQMRLEAREQQVYARREQPFHRRALPLVVTTVGVDVQANRIEASAWGYGPGMERWHLEHRKIAGIVEHPDVWRELVEFVLAHEATAVAVDAGYEGEKVTGHCQALVKELLRHRCLIWPVKGAAGKRPIWPGPKRPGEQVLVGVDAAKMAFYGALERVTEPGPGYVHISTNQGQRWFRQLFAERPAGPGDPRGTRWVTVPGRNRNEALDCAVYADAAAHGVAALDDGMRDRLIVGDRRLRTPPPKPRPTPQAQRAAARRDERRGKRKSWVRR